MNSIPNLISTIVTPALAQSTEQAVNSGGVSTQILGIGVLIALIFVIIKGIKLISGDSKSIQQSLIIWIASIVVLIFFSVGFINSVNTKTDIAGDRESIDTLDLRSIADFFRAPIEDKPDLVLDDDDIENMDDKEDSNIDEDKGVPIKIGESYQPPDNAFTRSIIRIFTRQNDSVQQEDDTPDDSNDEYAETRTLRVSITANPRSGTNPLNYVNLIANISGSAQGNINYTFYCDRADTGKNLTNGWTKKKDNTSQNPYTATDACSYENPGVYTAKVIVERGSLTAEARTTINVSRAYSPGSSTPENIPPVVSITSPGDTVTFNEGDDITIKASASDQDGSIDRVRFYVDGTLI